MRQLSRVWVRIFISFVGGAVCTTITNAISSHRLTQDQSNLIGVLSALIIYAVLTFFVKQYIRNL